MSGTNPKAALAGLLDGARALYREGALHITPTSMTAENDRVAVEATSFATMEDGRIYANSYHFLVTVRDGKVATVREYMDTIHARETFFGRSEEHTSELQSLMRISYAVFCLKKKQQVKTMTLVDKR